MGQLLAMLEEAADLDGHRLAVAEGNARITYEELAQQIRRLTAELQRGRPSVYGLVMDQTLPSVLLLLALLESGHAVLPVDDLLTPSELQRIGLVGQVQGWVVPDRQTSLGAQGEREEEQRIPYSRFFRDETAYAGTGTAIPDREQGTDGSNPRGHASCRLNSMNNSGHSPILYQLTSGTTGEPKLARLAWRTVLREGSVYSDWFGYHAADIVVLTAPLNHLYGLSAGLFASLCARSTLVICRRPTPRKAIRLVHDCGATILIGVPQFYQLMSDVHQPAQADRRQMRFAVSAGGPLPLELPRAYEKKWGHRLLQVYGSTETGAVAAQHPARTYEAACTGELLPGVRAWIHEEQRLVVQSPSLFSGYVTAGGEENPITDGSYVTDDLAVLSQGRVYLQGRLPKFINVAGRKVNPREVEEACRDMPGISEVSVYGKPDQLHGEIIVARIAADKSLSIREIKAYLRRHLADYKVPHLIERAERLARTWKERYAVEEEGAEDGSNCDRANY
ncbi:class I adenylate-forming enzyme family protein [Xylanibacillus composti]|uniref:Uncharacterized protein n=1 Tax=Xylanibacillus composti TaxID=1572762 RepID=A0A8J4H1U3_9BACL|nr:class I adenylate-forming enzyme family protein [Xylanibacillus composti]GIQ69344.1 hypothetical protein XYCOK13_21680 [Xylanibacillus composti]